jgi:NADP-dependent 3-hydroxy acid dehydrogenase YdfG
MKSPVILITGASQGIGAALARVFAAEVPGVRLALVARNRRKLAAVARACVTSGSRAGTAPATPEIFPCDVTDEAAVSGLAKSVSGRFGGVDVLINNAGAFAGAPLTRMSVTAFDQIIAANLRSVFLVSRAFLPGMVRRRRGDVFNMSSIAAQTAYPGGAAYSAAKAGVAALSRVMRAEFKTKGVRVCCVFPGATWSPSWAGTGIPAGRMMPAEDVARAFLDVYRLTRRTVVEEIALRPQLGDV